MAMVSEPVTRRRKKRPLTGGTGVSAGRRENTRARLDLAFGWASAASWAALEGRRGKE